MNVLQFKKKNKQQLLNVNHFSSERISIPQDASAIGIDLGTTNSVVSLFSPEASHPVTLKYEDSFLVPSMVFYDHEMKKEYVGRKAKKHIEVMPSQVIKSTKRNMGKSGINFESNQKNYTPEDVAALLLGYLLSHPFLQAEKEKYGIIWAVITVPAHFDDAARLATIAAAEKVGIRVLRIVNEPTAAALAYSMMPEDKSKNKEILAVFDFGGGTFDVSIVEREGSVFHVLSSEGEVNLGGDDLDEALANFFLAHVQPPLVARRSTKNSELYRNLLVHAERAKKILQTQGSLHLVDNNVDKKGSLLSVELTREQFESIITPFLQRTLTLTENALHAARCDSQRISRILLVGGSTRLNFVRKMLCDYFLCPVDGRLEPDLAVSWGAALQAAIILGIQPDTILVDVCSHTLGIGVVENTASVQENFKLVAKKFGFPHTISEQELCKKLGSRLVNFNKELQKMLHVAPILYRNSVLPAIRSEFFNTIYDNQHAVHVVVVQGEGKTVGENRLIGSFLFELEQPCPKGTRCEIQLTYDVNGMVQVFAKQFGTKNEVKAQFDSRTGEVTGWTVIQKQNSPSSIVLTSTQTTADVETQEQANILSFPTAKKYKTSSDASEKEVAFSGGIVINALFLRVKKYLSQLDKTSAQFIKISEVLFSYTKLLQQAQEGAENDDELEIVENNLLDLLERKD